MDFILSSDNPLGKVKYNFWRREYQGRGMDHFHIVLWIEGAPVMDKSPEEIIRSFILQRIKCRIPDPRISPELHRKVKYQEHRCNGYCTRRIQTKTGFKSICRFSFPCLQRDSLQMHKTKTAIINRRKLKKHSRLYDLPRKANELFINDYNPAIQLVWEGNTDIQFIADSFQIIIDYITKYITKMEKSHLDYESIKSCDSLLQAIWSFAVKATSNREIGSMEAADTLLGHSLYGKDKKTMIRWLDIREIRNRKLKTFEDIKKLDGESTDIFCESLIDSHYPNRHNELENLCLYEFAKDYDPVDSELKTIKCYKMREGKWFCRKRKNPYLINHWKNNPFTEPENYYHTLLLLFKPWRYETSDFKGEYATYEEAFNKIAHELPQAVEYHLKYTEKLQAQELFNKDVEKAVEEENDKTQENLSNNIPDGCVPAGVNMLINDFEDLANRVELDYDEETEKTLNEDQSRIFENWKNCLSNCILIRQIISGFAGTGKSEIIKRIVRYNKDVRGKLTITLGPTGLAALSINGLTIHKFFLIPVSDDGIPEYKELSPAALKTLREALKDVDLLIIDEISMVSNFLLAFINQRLVEIFNTADDKDGWFGKINIILLGDLLQLRPVKSDFVFEDLNASKFKESMKAMFGHNLWRKCFTYDELTINMRQQGDKTFSDILHRIRLRVVTKEDISVLEKRLLKFESANPKNRLEELCAYFKKLPYNTVCLLPTLLMCNVLNKAMLEKIPSEEIKLIANDEFKCDNSVRKKIEEDLEDSNKKVTATAGVLKVITIKIGCRIMVRKNIGIASGLVNGTIATVCSLQKNTSNEIEQIEIELQNKSRHFIKKEPYKFLIRKGITVTREQFPIMLCYGITIHKSQGLSLENAVMDIGNSIFEPGQAYVALSRVTTLEGVHLINLSPIKITANEDALHEYNILRKSFTKLQPLTEKPASCKIYNSERVWANSDNIMDVQDSIIDTFDTYELYHIQNNDKFSSYVHSLIQSLFYFPLIRYQFNLSNVNFIKKLYDTYLLKVRIDLFEFKNYVHSKFASDVEYDVCYFLNDFCTVSLMNVMRDLNIRRLNVY